MNLRMRKRTKGHHEQKGGNSCLESTCRNPTGKIYVVYLLSIIHHAPTLSFRRGSCEHGDIGRLANNRVVKG